MNGANSLPLHENSLTAAANVFASHRCNGLQQIGRSEKITASVRECLDAWRHTEDCEITFPRRHMLDEIEPNWNAGRCVPDKPGGHS
jgi:hypothetical protein